MINWSEKFTAALLGTAVGDALGLPREGLSRCRAQKLFGNAPLTHRLVVRYGMISDDTEHACMAAQALLASRDNADAFARSLAWRLRGWLLGIPAGIGFATLRAILKLWVGFSPRHSGIHSAGNGPAMRAPILGLWMAATDMPLDTFKNLLRGCTRITHTDPRAYEGALAIALAAACPHGSLIETLLQHIEGPELRQHVKQAQRFLHRSAPTEEFAASLGLDNGVTGYINHTVPIALYCYLRWPGNFRHAVEDAILAGGDTDTTAALVGALAGAALGPTAIPTEWLSGLYEFPRSLAWIRALGNRLAQQAAAPQHPLGPLRLFWPALLLRNLFFAAVVLAHGLRRLLPPY